MEVVKKFTYDKRSKKITTVCIAVIIAAAFGVWFFSDKGGYFSAWLYSFLAAVLALFILSIPRYAEVNEAAVEIHCVVEMTRIPLPDINSVRTIGRSEMKKIFPVLGSYGFFGYFGYYLDTVNWEFVKIYCRQWDNFIEIRDIYEQRYIISCPAPQDFVDEILAFMEDYSERLGS